MIASGIYKNGKNLMRFFIQIGLLTGCILMFSVAWSQTGQNGVKPGSEYDGLPITEFLDKAEKEYGVSFYYDVDALPDIEIRMSGDAQTLKTILNANLNRNGFDVSVDANGNIFILKSGKIKTSISNEVFKERQIIRPAQEKTVSEEEKPDEFAETEKEYVSKTYTIGNKKEGAKRSKATLSGYITSVENNEPLINATIYVQELQKGTTTNENGHYSITLKKGNYTLIAKSVETKEEKFRINLLSDGKLDLKLEPQLFMLNEIVISSEKYHNVKGTQMGFEKISTREIKELPMVLGERDIIKVAHLLPGVLSVAEGSASFNVRGSPADQNLFFINNVPVYNTSHFLGFFSSFNSNAIEEFTMYKGNIPVNYGGRLSSFFDIKANEGKQDRFSARGEISPITSGAVVEGPIGEKANYMAGLRTTYSDWVLGLVENPDIRDSEADFADFIGNFTIRPDEKNKLNLFAYHSYDHLDLVELAKTNYKNTGASLSWDHFWNNNKKLNVSLIYGNYQFGQENSELDLAAYKHAYELDHLELKASYSWKISEQHDIEVGVNSIFYRLDKGDILPLTETSLISKRTFEKERGVESAIYLGDSWDVSDKLELSGGVRFNTYSYLGPKTVMNYFENAPKIKSNITDTTYYSSGDIIKTYNGMDYRIAAKLLLGKSSSVKAGYNRLHQYIFLLTNTVSVSPSDLWKLSDYHIKPMTGDQYSVGFYTDIWGGFLEVSMEAYYKKVKDLVEYKDGAEFLINQLPETDIVQGKLDAYGIELMIRKPYGRLNGWMNYTYSDATIEVENEITGEENNFGMPYPANYDRPHAFNLVANYKISKRFNISGAVVYATGRPITYPTSVYYQDGIEILNYSLRNEYRLPDYFRIDLSIKIEGNLLAKKLAHGTFILSVYNLTGRKNAYSVYFKTEDNKINGYKLSIFGAPIPSITYSFKLGNYAD